MDTIAYDYKGRSYIIKGDPKNRRFDSQEEAREALNQDEKNQSEIDIDDINKRLQIASQLDKQDEERREDEAERKRMQDPKYVKGKFEELLKAIEKFK
jgi:hypothetical protein